MPRNKRNKHIYAIDNLSPKLHLLRMRLLTSILQIDPDHMQHIVSNFLPIESLDNFKWPIESAVKYFRFELYYEDDLINNEGELEAFWMFLIEGFDKEKADFVTMLDIPDFGWNTIREYPETYYNGELQWFDTESGEPVDINALKWDKI